MATMPDPQQAGEAQSLQSATMPVASSSSSSAATRPDAHAQRYDRQLRLWAASGQKSLESANVLLVGATHLGCQSLKNLILAGIGHFTVLDAQLVTEYDLGNNFFLEQDSCGKPRAKEVTKCLKELNPSVKGYGIYDDPCHHWVEDHDMIGSYDIIIAANQPPHVLDILCGIAWSCQPNVVCVRGAGMLGEVHVQIEELGFIETHPASTVDLRLTSPWPELEDYARSYNVDDQDALAHGHIPYIVILLRKLAEWREAHGGQLPVPSQDRKAFAQSIDAMRKPSVGDTENFDEAVAALGQAVWRPIAQGGRKVPAEVEALFKDEKCEKISSYSSSFWLLVRALRDFVEQGDGHLPLPGSLPDFKATSSTYADLQRLYKDKAKKDVETLKACLAAVLVKAKKPKNPVSDSEIESFAKHAGYLKLIRGRGYGHEDGPDAKPNKEAVHMAFMDPVNPSTLQHHIAFEAIDAFYAASGNRFPGCSLEMTDSLTGTGDIEAVEKANAIDLVEWAMSEDGKKAGYTVEKIEKAGMFERAGMSAASFASTSTSARDDNEPEKKRQRSDSPYVPTNSGGAGSSAMAATASGDAEMKTATPLLADEDAGSDDGDEKGQQSWEQDLAQCLALLERPGGILNKWGLTDKRGNDIGTGADLVRESVREIVRSGHGDVASTASLLGGIVGQEAIKVITRQYVPLGQGRGLAVYDGIKQAIGSFADV